MGSWHDARIQPGFGTSAVLMISTLMLGYQGPDSRIQI
jgi:hypothetical protein